jgi:DNA transposition AAA+ family ATPase
MSTTTTTTAIIPAAGSGSLAITATDFEGVLANIYTEEQAEVLRFWFFTARERGWKLSRIANETGLSTTVLHRLFRGEYPADPASSIAKLIRARQSFRESADNPDFIETSLSRRMFAIFDKTRALKNVSILWGRMGIGKTECIKEYYRKNNSGRTAWVRFPAGATFAFFIQHVSRSLGIATRQHSAFTQREKIIQILNAGQRLLIVDELHQAFLTTRSDTAVKCCEFLREIADQAECGLALVGTEVLEKEIFRGTHKDALLQLVDRGTVQCALPDKASRADYQKFLAAYGLQFPSPDAEPEAHQILSDIIKSSGLRKLTLHLRDGAAHASKQQEPYTWHHFVEAFQAIQSLSK